MNAIIPQMLIIPVCYSVHFLLVFIYLLSYLLFVTFRICPVLVDHRNCSKIVHISTRSSLSFYKTFKSEEFVQRSLIFIIFNVCGCMASVLDWLRVIPPCKMDLCLFENLMLVVLMYYFVSVLFVLYYFPYVLLISFNVIYHVIYNLILSSLTFRQCGRFFDFNGFSRDSAH